MQNDVRFESMKAMSIFLNEVIPLWIDSIYIYLIYHIVSVNTTYKFLDLLLHVSTYISHHSGVPMNPDYFTICFCAFGIPDGLQFSYAYNVIVIYYSCVFWVCVCVVQSSLFHKKLINSNNNFLASYETWGFVTVASKWTFSWTS